MDQTDLGTLVRVNLDLPIFRGIREKVAFGLPDRGYNLYAADAWDMAGLLMESYSTRKFKSIGQIYDYIAETGVRLAMDILDDLPYGGQVRRG